MLDSIKRLGASEVAALLREDIAAGRLNDHDRLPSERVLAETYGVARGTVRAALGRLADEGRVVIRPGSGAYVAEQVADSGDEVIRNARPLELINARFALEPHICRLAVLHARQEDLERAEALLLRMETCGDDVIAFSETDGAFHTLLAEVTENRLLLWVVGHINAVRNQDQWSRMRSLVLTPETIRLYNSQHRAIVDAIRERDPEKAANTMKEHLGAARLTLTSAAEA